MWLWNPETRAIEPAAHRIENGRTIVPLRLESEGAVFVVFRAPAAAFWVNRIVGDRQPGAAQTFTYTPMPFYRADSPLLPSGLPGPVRVLSVSAR